jgi:NTP pyrophosphatase (non-canonical NTP hydrolase)
MTDQAKVLGTEKLTKEFLSLFKHIQKRAHRTSLDHGFWDILGYINDMEEECIMSPVKAAELRDAVKAQKIALAHSELSELLEAVRGPSKPCEKVPSITVVEEECADLLIRLMDFSQEYQVRLGLATLLKMEFNEGRPHKHGKRF